MDINLLKDLKNNTTVFHALVSGFFTVVINRAEVGSLLIFHYSKFEINNEIVHYSLLNVKLNSLCFGIQVEN